MFQDLLQQEPNKQFIDSKLIKYMDHRLVEAKSLVAQLAPFNISNGDVQGSNPPTPTIEWS